MEDFLCKLCVTRLLGVGEQIRTIFTYPERKLLLLVLGLIVGNYGIDSRLSVIVLNIDSNYVVMCVL